MIKKEYLQILSFLKVNSIQKNGIRRTGSILSNQIGRGFDFKDHKIYQMGDDTRFIDWNVSSRLGDIYVKNFYQEKDSSILIFLDISKSMNFSLVGDTKFEIAFQMMILTSLFYLENGYRIKIVLYSNKQNWTSESIKSKKELFSKLKLILDTKSDANITNHNTPFQLIKEGIAKQADVFFISDFIGVKSLKKFNILKKSHNISAICIEDISESWNEPKLFRFFSLRDNESNHESSTQSFKKSSKDTILKEFFNHRILKIKTDILPNQKIIRFFQTI